MGILIALACTFPQESTPGIILGVFTFCAPVLLVTLQLPCVLLVICFGDPVKAALGVALKCVLNSYSIEVLLPLQLAISNAHSPRRVHRSTHLSFVPG